MKLSTPLFFLSGSATSPVQAEPSEIQKKARLFGQREAKILPFSIVLL
jgi:hypothetical protein